MVCMEQVGAITNAVLGLDDPEEEENAYIEDSITRANLLSSDMGSPQRGLEAYEHGQFSRDGLILECDEPRDLRLWFSKDDIRRAFATHSTYPQNQGHCATGQAWRLSRIYRMPPRNRHGRKSNRQPKLDRAVRHDVNQRFEGGKSGYCCGIDDLWQ